MTKYETLGQNVFVKELKPEEKVGGFVMPDSITDVDFSRGEVIYCNDGYFDQGVFIQAPVKIGDVVLFPKVSGTKVTLDGEKLIRVYMSDLVIKEIKGE